MCIALSWSLVPDGDDLRWGPPAPAAGLIRAPGGWRYHRAGGLPGPLLPLDAPGRLRWSLRPGGGPLVARLDPAILLLPGGHLELWLGLPLVHALVFDGDGATLDELPRGLRRTILGRTDRGLILPCVDSPVLSGPNDPSLAPAWWAVRVKVRNEGIDSTLLRRVPVHEPGLPVWRAGDRAAGGDVVVTLSSDATAEARLSPGEPPPGFESASELSSARESTPLSWLHDVSRRPVEFHP